MLYNAASVLTLVLGVACMYVLLFTITLLAAGAVIADDYLRVKLGHPVGVTDYATLAWLSSTATRTASGWQTCRGQASGVGSQESIMRLPRTVDWRDRTVAWDKIGTGPAVVLCHGTPWSSQLWAPFARALSREFTVYLWDMPGYGQSSMRPGHAVDLGTQGELLADLLEHWDLAAPHVVAHDYGGAVSLRAHLVHGREYASLALVDVVALRPWGSDFFRLVADNAEVFTAQPATVHRGALEAYIRTASHRGLSAGQLDTLTEPWLTPEGQRAFYAQIAAADQRFTDEIEDRYAELDLPVTILWGAQDSWIPVDRANRLADMIPGSTLEIIEEAGHLIHYDAPVELAMSLHGWLSGRAAAA